MNLDKENQAPNKFHASEVFLVDLADAETPVEVLRSLTTASKIFNHNDSQAHDVEMQDGVAQALTRTLTSTLRLEPPKWDKSLLHCLSHERALRISVLCTALEKVFQCSEKVLMVYLEDLISQGLLKSMVRIVELFIQFLTLPIVRDVALSKASRILYLLAKYAQEFPTDMVPSLRLLLRAHVSSDTRIDAACAIASLLAHSNSAKFPHMIKELIMTTPYVISTLSTASECAPTEQLPEVSRAILQIARNSSTGLIRISSRRDTVVNIVQLLQMRKTQSDALRIVALLLNCDATAKKLLISNPSTGLNVLQGLAKVSQTDQINDPNKDLAIAILLSVLDSIELLFQHKRVVNDALIGVAFIERNNQLRAEVAFGLCRQLLKKIDKLDEEAKILYPTIIDFLQFPFHSVRLEALFTLEVCTWNKEAARALIDEYAFVDNLTAIIVTDTHRDEQITALSILYNCSIDRECRETICLNTTLLTAIVDYTIRQNAIEKSTDMKSLEIILNLIAARSNRAHFKEFTELLPWLASIAAVTESDDLKQKVVKSIIYLSQVYLEGGIPNRFLV